MIHLENVLKISLQDILKMSLKRLEDVLKTSLQRISKTFCLKTSSREMFAGNLHQREELCSEQILMKGKFFWILYLFTAFQEKLSNSE